ncbi:hypothetical protein [Sediminimonas sp.]|uniref:hypothetical protein n=1 Tax=Sediminimonas sp. TaxID=2823379 RepID=UPI0025F32490|nr:hypothetical protein [Sediminimonas sp.]
MKTEIERLTAENEHLGKACARWAEVSQNNRQRAKTAEAERDRLQKAGDRLSFCAQASGGSAGQDADLVDAINGWAEARSALQTDTDTEGKADDCD